MDNVLGVQLDANAPTAEWTSGHRTVLPFLPNIIGNAASQNILAQDARYVADMAKIPEAGPCSSLVTWLDKNMPKTDLFSAAREALSLNKSVVVKGYVDFGSFELTPTHLEEHFMISPHSPVDAHGTFTCSPPQTLTRHPLDMAMRAKDSINLYTQTNVEEFVRDVANTGVIRAALTFPLPQHTAPSPFEYAPSQPYYLNCALSPVQKARRRSCPRLGSDTSTRAH